MLNHLHPRFTIIRSTSFSHHFFLIVFHLISICVNLKSPEWKCLTNVKTPRQTIEMMQNLFCNPLKVNLTAKCWHWEHYISNGKSRRRRRTTFTEEEEFRYYSGRDISGTFSIEADKVRGSSVKSMVKLNLKIDYEFADEISMLDYNTQKDLFIARNRPKDHYMDFVEEKLIDGYDDYVLIKMNDGTSLTMNKFLFIFFLILVPIIELYKIYLKIVWLDQSFTIKKVISTRFDLNQNQYVKQYSMNLPKVLLAGNEQTFENVHHTREKIYDLPTEDEINRAPAMNQMLLKRLTSYNINLEEEAGENQRPAPQNNLYADFPQGQMQMQGNPSNNNIAAPLLPDFNPQPPIYSPYAVNVNTKNSIDSDAELSVSNSTEGLENKLL